MFFPFKIAVGEDGRSFEIFKSMLGECAMTNCIAVWLIEKGTGWTRIYK